MPTPWKNVTTTDNYAKFPQTHQDRKMLNFSEHRKNKRNITAHDQYEISMFNGI